MRTRSSRGIASRNSWGDVFKAVNIDEPLMHSEGSVDFALLVAWRHILTLNILLWYKKIKNAWTNQRAGSGRPLRLNCCKGHQRITNADALNWNRPSSFHRVYGIYVYGVLFIWDHRSQRCPVCTCLLMHFSCFPPGWPLSHVPQQWQTENKWGCGSGSRGENINPNL